MRGSAFILGKETQMEDHHHSGWKFFALLFGALLAGGIGYYIYKQRNPQYDPWEEPWENSSSPVDLDLDDDNSGAARHANDDNASAAQ